MNARYLATLLLVLSMLVMGGCQCLTAAAARTCASACAQSLRAMASWDGERCVCEGAAVVRVGPDGGAP